MRLKTNIFLWVFLATVVPLTILVLGATTYSERLYRADVNRDVTSSLSSIVSEIDRTWYYQRQLVLSLANAPAMQQYLPVLDYMVEGRQHPTFFERAEKLKQFLAAFQGVVPNFNTLRVLDMRANTLVKVHFGAGSVGTFAGIESFPYAEEELDDRSFADRLGELARGDVSFVVLPESRWDRDGLRGPAMLNAVVPLVKDGQVVGYLMADFSGDQIDRILELSPRLHQAELMIAELNPDHPDRDGLVLYDDDGGLRFSKGRGVPHDLEELGYSALWKAAQRQPYGALRAGDDGTRFFYVEYLPYSNQLSSWVVAARVDMASVLAPFNRIRLGIVLFATVALMLSLFLAHHGARKIAGPVTEMANSLKRYADGERQVRVQARGAEEIQQLESSFNYMATTLEHAQQERDRAQHMMLQSAKLASIGEMAAGIGHEINNPLNNILSLSKLVLRSLPHDESGKARRDVESLREEALRASRIVRGVLDFARQETPHYSRFQVQDWLDEALLLVQQQARKQRVELRLHVAGDFYAEGDRSQLQQVLVNLLLNAIQASPSGALVQVNVNADDDRLGLEVTDEGGGIDPQILERVFDPFFTTKAVGEGSGLGLSISLGIVERHNGQLTVENNDRGGVTATVILPAPQRTSVREQQQEAAS